MTKTQTAINFFKEKDYKNALKLFKTFKIGFDKTESKQICRTYEMFTNRKFYEQLGFNFKCELHKAIEIINNKYIKEEGK